MLRRQSRSRGRRRRLRRAAHALAPVVPRDQRQPLLVPAPNLFLGLGQRQARFDQLPDGLVALGRAGLDLAQARLGRSEGAGELLLLLLLFLLLLMLRLLLPCPRGRRRIAPRPKSDDRVAPLQG
jgi:hypothetical protein